ncbi:MAG TPA: AAA family ATPase [Pyrinomonadaceae bacterium]
MIETLAISNYRSILKLVLPLGRLNVITGPNGSGKSNLYRAIRLLAETAHDGVISALAREGGLHSTFWAGPEDLSRRMRSGDVPVQGTSSGTKKRMRMGFGSQEFSYSISLGLPPPDNSSSPSLFTLDPMIKHEAIWAGQMLRPSATLLERDHSVVKVRGDSGWDVLAKDIRSFDSVFSQLADTSTTPEVFWLREQMRGWRFYDHFRTDRDSPSRQPQIGTRTPVLRHDGSDLAAALQTIIEVGDRRNLESVIAEAFDGASVSVNSNEDGRFTVLFRQYGLLRPLTAAELSDGTLRFLLLTAALLTPRPPSMMVLNEPETSLHPDVIPALAKLILNAAESSQVWVVTHSAKLIAALKRKSCNLLELEKKLGSTNLKGKSEFDGPSWKWPD